MPNKHYYKTNTHWTGNTGQGTASYIGYERSHAVHSLGKEPIQCSSDPSFRGDASKYNPEELLLASLSSCHMLWYLHLCSVAGITVTAYVDNAFAIMEESAEGSGRFTSATLRPEVTILEQDQLDEAQLLHTEANKKCFIANSVNFPVLHEASTFIGS